MLSKDIKRTLFVKFILLILLWFICFRDHKPEIDLAQHLYANTQSDGFKASVKSIT